MKMQTLIVPDSDSTRTVFYRPANKKTMHEHWTINKTLPEVRIQIVPKGSNFKT